MRQQVSGVLVVNDIGNVRAEKWNKGDKQVSDFVEKRSGVSAMLRLRLDEFKRKRLA